jgi:hypothetical protein
VHGSGGISAYVVEWIPLLNAMGIALGDFQRVPRSQMAMSAIGGAAENIFS